MNKKNYSNFDYDNLTEIYFNNPWLKHEANHVGFEKLWFDYKLKKQKNIIKKLIDNFNYVQMESASLVVMKKLSKAINEWNISPQDTIFVDFKKHTHPDGSNVFSNFLKPILFELNDAWREVNLESSLSYGIRRIKKGGNRSVGIELKKLVLIDDFIGTGGTAIKAVRLIKDEILESGNEIELFVFSLGGMKDGLRHLYKETFVKYEVCYTQRKGTELGYPKGERKFIRRLIQNMETILSKGNERMKLEDHTLGYGMSEALYSCTKFNIPNNNYPILWWNRYRNENYRKPLFNRMQ